MLAVFFVTQQQEESRILGVRIWQEKARKIWHFLDFCWRIPLDEKKYRSWISKTERGSTVSSKRFDETSVQPQQKCRCLCENMRKTISPKVDEKTGESFSDVYFCQVSFFAFDTQAVCM